MSACSGTPANGWCSQCGGGHEPDDEMAIRLDLTRKQLSLMDRIHGDTEDTPQ